ncbi:MAG: helix-hairpin-helix domain-containing protein [Thermodesulfobacteriota bacterium]|nr:helix-hairpin-helix domain-containing protein [Thermodesulfobacteriota bacterium]
MQFLMRKLLVLILILSFVAVISPVYTNAENEGCKTDKVNINTASLDELQKIKGIGPELAQRIIDYKKEHGAFEKPHDITKVEGIGPKTFEAIKNIITVK